MKHLLLAILPARFRDWLMERGYRGSVRRMQGCEHAHTGFVDVGVVYEKCRDCWALRVPTLDGSDALKWTPNGASPKVSRWVDEEKP
jgi:hypothetical protein